MSSCAVQLNLTLQDVDPPVWRPIVVPGSMTLEQLHEVIQTVMGWLDYHLHLFEIAGVVYTSDDELGLDVVGDESETTLAEVARAGARFRYEYDFGDRWQHEVVVEDVRPGRAVTAHCRAGSGACPPEDCGGASGYRRLLAVLADPAHPDHDATFDAYGDLDPDDFDAAAANELLAR